MPLAFLLASLCGGLGAATRYLVDVGVARLSGARFPWGVPIINITGSFALGLVVTALPGAAFVLGAGFLGGYTTFSTAMLDAVSLWHEGRRAASVADAGGMLIAALAAAGLGLIVGTTL
ncbi:fluoride efflux transporter FluC [Microbacterium sp. USHLN186]|uniref:fluoride efflux transporter FluC n=1 Tax=Microbacterium sp. USHLN186 TaxID=3081286 RepID=UPI00301AA559